MTEKFTMFWDGPFSQWESADFELDGVEYNCAEQHMMAQKARLFEDEEKLEDIMDCDDPATQKEFGRHVDGFDKDIWEEDEDNGRPRCWNIVWRGNMAKFSQNPGLLAELLATKGTTLVEASPHDSIWGIGWRASDAGAKRRDTWRGTNWLGEVLDSVRDCLSRDPSPYLSSDDPREPV